MRRKTSICVNTGALRGLSSVLSFLDASRQDIGTTLTEKGHHVVLVGNKLSQLLFIHHFKGARTGAEGQVEEGQQ